MDYIAYRDDELYHFGIKGMKWGIRRWQNEDGSLTEAGHRHYDLKESKLAAKVVRGETRAQVKVAKIEAREAKRAQKAELKANRRNMKKQKYIDKLEVERLKLELKKMKKEKAFEKGKRFGDNFIPKFAESFGRTSGEALGNMINMANIQKWQTIGSTKTSSKAAYLKAKTERDKFKNSLEDQVEALIEQAEGGKKKK